MFFGGRGFFWNYIVRHETYIKMEKIGEKIKTGNREVEKKVFIDSLISDKPGLKSSL